MGAPFDLSAYLWPDAAMGRQPQGPIGLNPYWTARGLTLVFHGDRVLYDSSASATALKIGNGTPKRKITAKGAAQGCGSTYGSGTTDRLDGGVLKAPKSGYRSIVALLYANSTGGSALGRVFQDSVGTGATHGEGLYFTSAVAGSIQYVWSDGTLADGCYLNSAFPLTQWATIGVTASVQVGVHSGAMYVNGLAVATLTNNVATTALPADTALTFGNRTSDSARGFDGLIGPVLFFDGQLTAAEHLALSQNPWQVFDAPISVPMSVPASSGAVALAGNAAAVASASGALATSMPLAGAALGVSTATGAISAAFPLNGAAAAIASASGNLVLGIALSGTALAQAIASGALSSAFPLIGGANAQAAATGTMQIQIALQGAAVATASASGQLSVGGSGALAGNAQAQASASGSLSVSMPLAGSAQVVASATGNLITGTPLAGAAVAVSSASGNLIATVTLSGAAIAQAIAAGTLLIQVPLAGHAVAQAAASGYLSGGQSPLVSDPRYTVTRSARAFTVQRGARSFTVYAKQRNFTVTHAS